MLDCNGFEGLHQYSFSFICRNPLVWWYFRLAARHFIESSLIWPFLISWTDFGSWGSFWFFCVIFFRLFMKAKSSSRKSAFFLMIANCVQANIGISVHVWSWIYFSLNFSTFAVECDWNRILETIKIWGFWKIKWVFSNKILKIFKIATCGTFLNFVSNSNFS